MNLFCVNHLGRYDHTPASVLNAKNKEPALLSWFVF